MESSWAAAPASPFMARTAARATALPAPCRRAGSARAEAAAMRSKSPTSLKVALAQLRRGRNLDFPECMRSEFRIVSRLLLGHDLYEGIRSVIIDKDQAPHWQPSSLAAVSAAEVERHFEPLTHELALP